MTFNRKISSPLWAASLSITLLSACGSSGSNDAPKFSQNELSVTLTEDSTSDISLSATDANSDTITYSLANAASNGVVVIDPTTGESSYTPNTNFNGEDSFSVSASDGTDSSSVTINLAITPINDAPTFVQTTLLVSGSEQKIGQIDANDVDGDNLTYAVVTLPENGDFTLNTTTGAVTYTAEDIVEVNDTVIISVFDGIETITSTLNISSNLATNADRAYYYYASEQSHLKKAEALSADLADDINQGAINSALALGYAEAGLITKTEALLTSENITLPEVLASAKLAVADQFQALLLTDKASALRAQAKSEYNQSLAAKGLANFDNDDINFLLDLSNSYAKIDNQESELEVFDILDLLFSTVLTEEFNTAIYRAYFGYRNEVNDLVAVWQETQSDNDKARALQHLDKLYQYALQIAPREVSNNNNDNLGEFYHSIRQVALSNVIENYFYLNERSKAKEAAADLLALHGIVNYDESYAREADEYAAVTAVEYYAGISSNITWFVLLYPELDANLFINGIPEETTNYFGSVRDSAAEDAADAKLLATARIEPDGAVAFAAIQASRDESNLRNYYTNLIHFSSVEGNEGFADIRMDLNDYPSVVLAAEEALALISSEAYINEYLASESYIVGHSGCEAIINLYQQLAIEDTANQTTHQQAVIDTVKQCVALAQTYFANGDDATDVWIEDAISANANLLQYLLPLGLTDEADKVIATAELNLAKLSDALDESNSDYATKLEYYASRLKYMASDAYLGGDYELAQTLYNRAIDSLITIEQNVIDGDIGAVTEDFIDYRSGGDSNYYEFLATINENSTDIENYAEVMLQAKENLKRLLDIGYARVEEASQQTQLEFIPKYAEFYATLGYYNEALASLEHEILGDVEKVSIKTIIATLYAEQDHLAGQSIASVDTDGDGLPNFFSAFASDDDIEQSGLVLDLDSDNDGINDEDDNQPLTPNAE